MLFSNILRPMEHTILLTWFEWATRAFDCTLDVIVYLRTTPETCYQRIQDRARKEESSRVTLQYLEELHMLHEHWLVDYSQTDTKYKPRVLIVDTDYASPETVYANIQHSLSYINK